VEIIQFVLVAIALAWIFWDDNPHETVPILRERKQRWDSAEKQHANIAQNKIGGQYGGTGGGSAATHKP
jgi:hypothetical protein